MFSKCHQVNPQKLSFNFSTAAQFPGDLVKPIPSPVQTFHFSGLHYLFYSNISRLLTPYCCLLPVYYPPLSGSFVDFHSEDSSKMPAATAKHLVLQQPSVIVLPQYPPILQNEQPKTRFQKGQQENWKIAEIQLSISCYLTFLNVLS